MRAEDGARVDALLTAGASADVRESARLPGGRDLRGFWQWLIAVQHPTGNTALQLALDPNHPDGTEVASILLRHGAHANGIDEDGRTLIDDVVDVYGLTDLDLVDLLLDRGCSPIVEHQDLLEFASEMDSEELVRIALKHEGKQHAVQAMSFAIEVGSIDSLRTLLQNGISPNLIDSHGDTPLTIACAKDTYDDVEGYVGKGISLRREIVHMLLASGADPGLRDSGGQTPLQLAAKIHDKGLMRLLESALKRQPGGK